MTLLCANCGDPVPPDVDHIRIEVTERRMEGRDTTTEYYLHPDCALAVTEDWNEP